MFFVTGLTHVDYDKSPTVLGYDHPDAVPIPNKHTFGYFEKLTSAKVFVEHNDVDINENGHYKFIVIEFIDVGYFYPTAVEAAWYEWKDGKYVAIPKPQSTNSICNFAF